MKNTNDTIKLRGFFHIQITEDLSSGGVKVVGDSGWVENTVVNTGFRDYLVDHIIGSNEKFVKYAALGTGAAPGVTDTGIAGELQHATNNNRVLITGGTSIVASKTAQFTGQFASSASYVTASADISNIGLFNEQSDTGADLFAGNTYASSSFATNQNVNFTYQIRFS